MKRKSRTKADLLKEVSRLRKNNKEKKFAAAKIKKIIMPSFSELQHIFLNSLNDGILIFECPAKESAAFRFYEANAVACRLLGYSKEELVDKNIFEIFAPETVLHVEKMLHMLMLQKHCVWEGMHQAKNGRRIPVEVNSHIFKSSGKQAVLLAVKDITLRKRAEEEHRKAEEAMRSSESRFRTLAEASFEGIAVTENDVIIDLNDQLAKMCGYDRNELIGKPFIYIVVPELQGKIKQAIKIEKKDIIEIQSMRRDSTIFSAEIRTRSNVINDKELQIFTVRDITERKKAEEALMNEKAFLDALMDNIPDSIYFKDRHCRIMRVNQKEMRDLNISDMNLIVGKTDEELFGEEFGKETILSEKHLMDSGEPVIGLVEIRRMKNGQLNWTSTTKVPLRNSNNDIVGLVGITREINEIMKAQEELKRERTLLRTLIDNLPDYIYIKDTEGRFIIGNKAVVNSFGFSYEKSLIGKTDFDLFPEDMAKKFREYEQSIIMTGKGIFDHEGTTIDISKKEKERWISTTKVPIWDTQGKVIGTVGIGRDLTDRKRMEEELRENADKFRFIFENAYDGISIFEETYDPKTRRLVNCNKSYAEMSGRSREELLEIGNTTNIAKTLTENSRDSNSENVVFKGSFSWIRPDKKENVIEYTAVPIKVKGKTITIGIDRDITERKRIEEERERLIKDLQGALADVKTLSGLVPICSNCKKIRNDKGFWMQVESYIQEHSQAQFSHGICPDCMRKLYPNIIPGDSD